MLTVFPVTGLPEIVPGCALDEMLGNSLQSIAPRSGDLLVVTQKIVSKAEGCYISLRDVAPSAEAAELARETGKDPQLVELVLREAKDVLRAVPGVLITRHRSGLVMANSGIDQSNLGPDGNDRVLLLPRDSDASAERIRRALEKRFSCDLAVVISDSFGRPWRNGVTNVAIGVAGMPALQDRRGEIDRDGRVLEVTQIALADMAACAAGLVMGEGAEGIPAALVRGVDLDAAPHCPASSMIRPESQDLFR